MGWPRNDGGMPEIRRDDLQLLWELKYFVTEETFAQLDKRIKVKLGVGGTPDLMEFIRDIKDIENSQPNLRPKQILMAPSMQNVGWDPPKRWKTWFWRHIEPKNLILPHDDKKNITQKNGDFHH